MAQGLNPGDIFAGYRIRGPLGRGGMGSVYAADHPRLPRVVAIKTLTAAADDREAMARFEREAEMIARLDHPGIVSVLDRGVEQGIPWISMQFVQGSDAAATLREHGPLPLDRVATIARQTADALDYAHAHGVLHRDVKPGNIMLETGGAGRALLTDFGIATVLDHSRDITATGQTLATFDYASPEQLRGQPMDGRTDQYSLACTIHALLTGRPPFSSDNIATVVQGHLTAAPPSVSVTRPEVSPAISGVILRALAKDPADRFPSCHDFAEALHRAATGVPTDAAAPATTARPRRSRALMWGAGAAAVAVLATGGYGISRSLSSSASSPTVATTGPQPTGPQPTGGGTATGPSTDTIDGPTTPTRMPTGGDDGPGQLAVWPQVEPAQKLWPDLLPQSPTGTGYSGLKCSAVTKATTGGMPQYTYRLNCARPDGLKLEMLAYDDPVHVSRLAEHYGAKKPSSVTALNGSTVNVYKFTDPDTAEQWMLLQVQTSDDKKSYAFQLSGLTWKKLTVFIDLAPW